MYVCAVSKHVDLFMGNLHVLYVLWHLSAGSPSARERREWWGSGATIAVVTTGFDSMRSCWRGEGRTTR